MQNVHIRDFLKIPSMLLLLTHTHLLPAPKTPSLGHQHRRPPAPQLDPLLSARMPPLVPPQMVGRMNWTLTTAIRRSMDWRSPYISALPVRRVLALSPHLDLARTRNATELHRLVYGLVQVGSEGLASGGTGGRS